MLNSSNFVELRKRGAEAVRWLAIFCFAASGAFFVLEYGPQWAVALTVPAVFGALVFALLQRKARRTAALVLACGVAFGSCYMALYDFLFAAPCARLADTEQTVTVSLCAYPQPHTYGAKAVAYLDTDAPVPVKVQLYGGDELLDCAPGDRITTRAKLRDATVSHGEKITAFTAKGVRLLVYSKGTPEILHLQSVPLRYVPLQLNRVLQQKTLQLYAGEPRILMTALLTGDRTGFDDTLYSLLSETGVTHVTAVSGMHCAFLFGMVRLLVRDRRRATLVGLPLIFLFALMVGAAPSVTRACLMLTMLSLAPLLHRENDSITTLSAALLLILLGNPHAIASISLQLSFLSVAGILLFSQKIYTALQRIILRKGKTGGRLWALLLSALATTFAASVFTVPLSAVYFDCVSLISPLTNLLVLGAVSFAFCTGLVSVLLGFLWMPLAEIAAIPAAAALEYFMAVVRLLAAVPYHAIYTANPYLAGWLFYFYAVAAVLAASRCRRIRTLTVSAAAVALSLVLVLALPVMSSGRAGLTAKVLNVGQGESVLFLSGAQAALVDCGSSNTWVNAGSVAANALNTMGKTELDYLILTHYHNDHANGLDTLFSRVRVKRLIVPQVHGASDQALEQEVLALAKQYGAEVTRLSDLRQFQLGGAEMMLFPPLGAGSTNEEGLSLLCSCGDFDMLVTGDMDIDTEQRLLDSYTLPDIEVLVAGHHGSKNSSGDPLLSAASPEIAVIPVGTNSYGHPTPEVLRRLVRAGVEVYRTDCNGTVSVVVS